MQFQENKEKVIIIDFGSQLTKLIARRVRDLGVYSEIVTAKSVKKSIKNYDFIKGIILSGGPSTVTKDTFQSIPREIFNKNIPILGICYGLQLISKNIWRKNQIIKKRREFGRATIFSKEVDLF